MLTGVIYGAIVVVWAAYLVPLALRRHDEATRSRSIARFSSAMKVLARRGDGGATAVARSARVVITPKPKDSGPILPEPIADPEPRVLVTPRRNRAAERAAAARRRQVLSILVGFTTVVVLLALVGLLPRWSFVIPMGMIAAFLVTARRSVRRADEAYWTAAEVQPGPEQSSSVVVRRVAARVDAGRRPEDDEPTVTLTAAERQAAAMTEDQVAAVPLASPHGDSPQSDSPQGGSPQGGSLWDPLPVTLPGYVSAPVAKRSFRTIELGEPGTWSSGHSSADSETAAATSPAPKPAPVPAGSSRVDDDEPDEVAKAVNA